MTKRKLWALALKKSYYMTNLLFFVSHTKKSNKRKVSAGEMICNKTSKPGWTKGFTLFEQAKACEFVNPQR